MESFHFLVLNKFLNKFLNKDSLKERFSVSWVFFKDVGVLILLANKRTSETC